MRHILVVDDDPHMGLAIRAWLKQYGFKVGIADGGIAGLAAIDNSTFDLMIVDIFMPDMRGFESIRMFHERAPRVPLIAISGYAFSRSGGVQSRFPAIGAQAWRGALPAQAFQANNLVECDRRMPVGGRASSQVRQVGLRCGRGVGRGGIAGHAGKGDLYGLSLRFSGGDEVARAGSAQENQARKIWPANWPKAFSRLCFKRDSAEVSKRTKWGKRGCIRTQEFRN